MIQLKQVVTVLGAAAVAGMLFASIASWASAAEVPSSPAVTAGVFQATPTATAAATAAAPKATATAAAATPAKTGTGGVASPSGSALPALLGVAALAVVLVGGARLAMRRR